MYSAPNRIPHGAAAGDFLLCCFRSGLDCGMAFVVCPLTTDSMECVLAFILILFQVAQVGCF